MSEKITLTPADVYALWKETGQARCAPQYFDNYYGSWANCASGYRLSERMREAVRKLYLADKETKRAAEYKHRHPTNPSGKPAWNRGIHPSTNPLDKGYVQSNPFRAYRAANNMSLQTFAQRIGVSYGTVQFWNNNGATERTLDVCSMKLGKHFAQPYHDWENESPYDHDKSEIQRQFLIRKYTNIGHALLEVERTQRALRMEKRDLAKRAIRPGAPLDEMGDMVAALDRLHNREVAAEVRRIRLVEARERTKRALDAIKRDEEIAAEWAEKNKGEIAEFKPDWKLYYGMGLTGGKTVDEDFEKKVKSRDWATMRCVDSTGHLLLEDAIIAKIDKEKEGYFVKLDYNGRSHGISLMNNDDFIPLYGPPEGHALDDVRAYRVDKFNLSRHAPNMNGNALPGLLNAGQVNAHDSGDAGPRWDRQQAADQERENRKAAIRDARDAGIVLVRKQMEGIVVPPQSKIEVIAIEEPAPKVLPEGVDPMDLAIPIVDGTAKAAWRDDTKDWHHASGKDAGGVHHASRIRLHKRSHAHGKKKGTH